MKTISIIGSNSFLAKNFIQYCTDEKLDYKLKLYEQKKACNDKTTNIIDFDDLNSIGKIDFNVDIIMIFIGKTGVLQDIQNYIEYIHVNEVIFLNILSTYVLKKSNAKIIYPSSRLIFKSNNYGKVFEDSEIECKSVYAVTKWASENYLKVFANLYDIKYNILRICTTFGTLIESKGTYGTFEMLVRQAIDNKEIVLFGDGKQVKTFTHLEDICLAFKKLIDAKETIYKDYNLGGQQLSMLDMASYISKKYDVNIKFIEWPKNYKLVDGGSVVFDSSRFDNEFHMQYKVIL